MVADNSSKQDFVYVYVKSGRQDDWTINLSSFGYAHVNSNIQLLTVDVQHSNRSLNCHLGHGGKFAA